MTDYYVNHSTGSNGNAGTSAGVAFKDIRFAMRYLSATDRLFIDGSMPSDPFRATEDKTTVTASAQVLFDTVATFTGLGNSPQCLIMSRNLQEDADELFASPNMDAWFSDDTFYGADIFTAAEDAPTPERTLTNGSASMKIARTANTSGFTVTNMQVSTEQAFQLTINHVAEQTGNLRYRIRNRTDNEEWNGTAWAGGTSIVDIPSNYHAVPTVGDFETVTLNIDAIGGTPGYKKIDIIIDTVDTGAGFYVDTCSFKAINVWTEVQIDGINNVYELKQVDTHMVWTCSNSDWNSEGVNALRELGPPDVAGAKGGLTTFADVLTTPNSFAWEAHALRVNLGSGTLADTHIEGWHQYTVSQVLSTAAVELNNLHIACGKSSISFAANVTGTKQKYSHGFFVVKWSAGAAIDITDIDVGYAMKDGVVINGGSTEATFRGITVHDIGDDGVQAINGGTFNIRVGVGTTCGSSYYPGAAAFGSEGVGSAFDLKNVTAYNNYSWGIRAVDDPTLSSMTDVVAYGNATGEGAGHVDVAGDNTSNYATADRVHYGTLGTNTGISDGVNGCIELSATPFTSNPPNLNADAAAVGAGVKWWTGPNPVGGDGEPFSDMQTDAGGIQTTLYKLHPANQ